MSINKSAMLTKHIAIDFDLYPMHNTIGLGAEISWRGSKTDHTGFNAQITFPFFYIELGVYDIRHAEAKQS